jgi:hypothetical protein
MNIVKLNSARWVAALGWSALSQARSASRLKTGWTMLVSIADFENTIAVRSSFPEGPAATFFAPCVKWITRAGSQMGQGFVHRMA